MRECATRIMHSKLRFFINGSMKRNNQRSVLKCYSVKQLLSCFHQFIQVEYKPTRLPLYLSLKAVITITADNTLVFFSTFQRKKGLAFHVNHTHCKAILLIVG